MAIEITPITLTKDEQNIQAFNYNNGLVPPQPIYQLIAVNFLNLKANEVKRFVLSDQVNFPLLIRSYQVDITFDDSTTTQERQYHAPNVNLAVNLFDSGTDKLVHALTFQITSYPITPTHMIFLPNYDVEIKSASPVHKITFYCEPIYLTNIINFGAEAS